MITLGVHGCQLLAADVACCQAVNWYQPDNLCSISGKTFSIMPVSPL